MARRFPVPRTQSGAVDEAACILSYARKLGGEDVDPLQVSTALFKAAFTSLVRLADQDDRRHRLMSLVQERTYEILATGEDPGMPAMASAAADVPARAPARAPGLANRP